MSEQIVAKFEGSGGSLRLGVEGYQFPHILDDDWDSNWLIIVGEAEIGNRSWRFRDACLTTFEMERLADWLDAATTGKQSNPFCGFTEPNLDFERVSNEAIRIGFSLEAAPPWSSEDDDFGTHGFEVPVNDRLGLAATDLRRLLQTYPVRARHP
ncbi:hypothetical protein [Sphingobium sp.]|uniref:WapI family immunity protein n=1 Tax=Sphingobium sp. TaxID=1912891 RepID=UPI0026023BD3|nr:hypothetical protein [Sphingobium sp.]